MADATRKLYQVENGTSGVPPCTPVADKLRHRGADPVLQGSQGTERQTPDLLQVSEFGADASRPLQTQRKPPRRFSSVAGHVFDPLLTADDVADRLNVSKDWVWDHSSRKTPRLPVIRMGDGALRYRASAIEAFISERERLSAQRYGSR